MLPAKHKENHVGESPSTKATNNKRSVVMWRATAYLLLAGGMAAMLWPGIQWAHSEYQQYALRSEWDAAVQESQRTPSPKPTTRLATARLDLVSRAKRNKKIPGRRIKTSTLRWQPTRIVISSIGLDAMVVRGVTEKALRRGPGHDPLTSLPGQAGNCVIAAHRNAYGWWFYRLNKLGKGSLVTLQTPRASYIYRVAAMHVVPDTTSWVLEPPRNGNAAPRLTLYTCALPHGSKRIVVIANLVKRRSASTSM